MDCAGCKLTQVLKDSDLLKTVQLNNAGPKVTVSSSHTCESVKKPAPKPVETKAPSPKLEPKPKPKPQAITPKTEEAPKKEKKGSSTKKEAEVEIKKEGSKTTKAPKAAPKAKAPVDASKKSFKLSFVFPKSSKAQGFFSKTKPAIYFAVGQNITVEMVPAEGDEITVWENYFETPSPKSGLLAVRINPLIYDGKADSKARLTKIIELFSEERSYCIIDTDSADIFGPAYEEEKPKEKGNRGERSNKQSEPPTCHNCSKVGHIARNCPEKDTGDNTQERKPKREPRERREPRENKERKREDRPVKEFDPSTTECYNCKKTGHIARDCTEPKPKREREPRKQRTEEEQQQYLAEVKCRRCNEVGHLAKDCTAARNLDDVLCYKCQEKGHFAKDCQNESRPRADRPERSERPERTDRNERRGERSGRPNEGGRGRGGRYVEREKKDKAADNGPAVCERIFKSRDGAINEKRGCGGDHYYGKCPNAPVVCERFFTNREGFVTEKQGCLGEHPYNDCPKAVCNQCGNNHHSNVCPYIYRR